MLYKQRYHYWRLMRFDKPIGIFLLLWPTLWALWIAAHGVPDIKILVIFVLGVVVMRAAGCVINDVADRHFDSRVTRTANRPLASGDVNVKEALILFILLCVIAGGLVVLLNGLTIALAVVGLGLATGYPFLKRYTHLPQLGLGVAFAWSVPMAFAAQTGRVPVIAWLLFAAALLWPVAYDTVYAMVDREDDLKIGIKSSAILFGAHDRLIIMLLQLTMLLLLVVLGLQQQLSRWFYFGLLAAGLFMVYQHYLIRKCEPRQCLRAFLNNNWVGLVIFLGLLTL